MNHGMKITDYAYSDAELNHSHGYLLPELEGVIKSLSLDAAERSIFDLACGNGSVARHLTKLGFEVTGVDPSSEGIRYANLCSPDLRLYQGSAYDDLAASYGRFPVVISLEVIEHLYYPRKYASTLYSLLEDGGTAILSTPYHGYLKNLGMALGNKLDEHFTALWDHGHIKFWSFKTLRVLLEEAGFCDLRFRRVGRFPVFAKSMIAIARKDGS